MENPEGPKFLTELDLAGIDQRRIRLADDTLPDIDHGTRKKILTLLAHKDGVAIIEELLKSDVLNSKDIVNVGYRKAQLEVFRRLLQEPDFVEKYKTDTGVTQSGTEPAWQAYFERNPWVFGYGLNYIWCNNIPEAKLEQVVSGYDFAATGKRVDGLLHSSAQISHFVLVEVKTPSAELIAGSPRPGVWAPSADLIAGVAQIQKTVSRFKKRYFDQVALTDASGDPRGLDIYNVSPKSYLLVGDLGQFKAAQGVNIEKYASFQLFRALLKEPEIITFDELYARATAIVDMAEKQ